MSETISDIKRKFKELSFADYSDFIGAYQSDERSGVQTLIKKAEHEMKAYEQEEERLEKLSQYEKRYCAYSYICGIDEVGRGPLAGPVVAGAVILPKGCRIHGINDSKKLSGKKREQLYLEIKREALACAVGIVSPDRIDEINILQATYEAMRIAISKLSIEPDLLLNDAVTIPDVVIQQVPIIKGDAKSISIGAASIIAKVERDHLMEAYDKIFPEYGFASNKGYGSAEHIKALKTCGATPIHRNTFIKNFISEQAGLR